MSELVSIIIPTFNRVDKLKKAIFSILNQKYNNWELIIVDNESSDGTKEMIKNYKDSRIRFYSVNNKGVIGYSRNFGVKKSYGMYLAFLDSDDWWEKEKLSICIGLMKKQDKDICYHNCYLISNFNKKKTRCRKLLSNNFFDLIKNGNTIVTSSVILKKELFLKIGGFSEKKNIIGWEDYHLWLMLAKKKNNFLFISAYLGNCSIGGDNFDNPKRVIYNIENIKKFFINNLNLDTKNIWWISYAQAKANFQLGYYDVSLDLFRKSLLISSLFLSKFKSLYFITLIIYISFKNYLIKKKS